MKLCALIALIVLSQSNLLNAQLCTGSLGDPIIKIDFGTQYEPVPYKATSYEYVGGCPGKGQYTIDHFLFGCGDHSWLPIIGDHTGDENGDYMLINSAGTSGNVHIDTAKNLCGNTNYQYAAWVTDVMQSFTCGDHPALPNLTFYIETYDGVVLASHNIGDIPLSSSGFKTWNQFGFCFTTPADVNNVVLRITSNADPREVCGRTFAIDDITFNECGPSIAVTIDGTPGPAEVCADYNNPFILTATYSDGFADPALQWQSSLDTGKTWINIAGATTTSYVIPHRLIGPSSYRVLISERANIGAPNCSISSNKIFTYVHELIAHRPPQEFIGCTSKNLLLPATDPKALKVLWSGPNGYSYPLYDPPAVVPNVQYADTGLYTLKQTFYYGCTSLDSFYLKVFPGTTVNTIPATPLCEGMSEQLSASSADDVTYQWTPSTGLSNDAIPNPVAKPTDSTRYKIVTTNSYGCKDSAYLIVNVYRNAAGDAGPDKIIVVGDSSVLNATVKGTAINYYWTPSTFMNDDHLKTPTVFPVQDATYTLNVVSTVGCGSATDDVKVKVYTDVFVPSAFTPNGDGKNDIFRVSALDNYKIAKLLIYNRWGNLVFQAKGTYDGWDGTLHGLPQPAGVYVYYIEIQHPTRKKIVKQGTITLVR